MHLYVVVSVLISYKMQTPRSVSSSDDSNPHQPTPTQILLIPTLPNA